MASFDDMAMLFAINNVEEHENHNIYYERQTRNPDNVTDPCIWNNSSVLPILHELHRRNYNDFYLLGKYNLS